jgi:hypothetical protein
VSASRGVLGVRLAFASVAAMLAILALQHGVAAYEREAIVARAPRELPRPSALTALGVRVAPAPGVIALACRVEALSSDVAPVYQVMADGRIAVPRPPRLSSGTEPGAPRTAIVVPSGPFARWSPAARGAFVELLAALVPARPLPRDRVVLVDAPLSERDLQTVLAWLP